MRVALVGLLLLILTAFGSWFLLRSVSPPPEPPSPPHGEVWFDDVAHEVGVEFHHFDPATPFNLITETMGSGVAWIDYDGDGWPDLFCVQDGPLPPAAPDHSKTHKLYRNNRDGTFTDVTDQVGLNHSGFGMGCAVGDYDNDGFDDLLVTYLGGLTLFHNEPDPSAPGGRRFRDVTAQSKLTDPHWATSAAWGDLDGDGLLDLYVCNYVEIDPGKPVICKNEAQNAYFTCSPTAYPYVSHKLFRNNGDGTFTDVSLSSGIGALSAPGLAVMIVDVDGDGKPDIYVANDLSFAFLFRNLGGMKFEEVALSSGAALGPGGQRIAGMGIEAADFDGSGRPSLFVTNFQRSPNVLLLNRGNLRFEDASFQSGLGGPSLDRLKFGVCALDVDLDGNPDLAIANGHISRNAKELFTIPYAQEAQLFLGDGRGKFRDVSATSGSDFVKPRVGRGLARADFNYDGLPDLVMSSVGEDVAIFRNRTQTPHGWVSLELIGDGKASNRNAIGAVVTTESGGKVRQHYIAGGGSYLSANDRRLLLGLGDAAKLDVVRVRWPSGRTQEFRDLPARTRWRLREGVVAPEAFNPPGK